MPTSHEAAVAHLKTLSRADHPELEEVLAVVRQYPVQVQLACADAVKRGEDSAVLYPVKAIADQQAVEIQELLDALTSPVPERGPILINLADLTPEQRALALAADQAQRDKDAAAVAADDEKLATDSKL